MFEGAEKKLEILFSKEENLLKKPERFWEKALRAGGADIISSRDFSGGRSYILSESSLFLWPRRLILITCGKTRLARSFLRILKGFSKNSLEMVFFQRKNEFFPQEQKSSFKEDVRLIQKKLKGQSYQFGPLSGRHFFLFHSEGPFRPEPSDQTLELLMYDSRLIGNRLKREAIMNLKARLLQMFPGFELHDHLFEPPGWSANGFRGEEYYTFHITPGEPFFYASFETNFRQSLSHIGEKARLLFSPKDFDVISWTPEGFAEPPRIGGSSPQLHFQEVLPCGWRVAYKSFSAPSSGPARAFPLPDC